jgi:myo-inositol-1(or 4)-monophosphatase
MTIIPEQELLARLQAAEKVAREAGAHILEVAASGRLEIDTKSNDLDLVTRADKETETLITAALAQQFPEDSFVGEESGVRDSVGSRWRWAIDPLDGTGNFVQGIPHWCVSIGCLYDDVSAVGVIYDPSRHELFSAAKNAGSFMNASRLQPSAPQLAHSTWELGLSSSAHSREKAWRDVVRPQVGRVRANGSLALGLAWTALGRFDAFFCECVLQPWDYGAGEIICTEAGLEVLHLPYAEPYSAALLAIPPQWQAGICRDLGFKLD